MNSYHFCTFISHLQVCNVKYIFFKAREMISLKKERKEETDFKHCYFSVNFLIVRYIHSQRLVGCTYSILTKKSVTIKFTKPIWLTKKTVFFD